MKRLFTLALGAAFAFSAIAGTPAKPIPAWLKADGAVSAQRAHKSVYKSKIKSANAAIAKADDYDGDDEYEVVELPVPTGLKLEMNANGGIDFTWNAVENANYYAAIGSMIAPIAAGEVYTLANADFSKIDSEGTISEPVESDYLIESAEYFPGAQFILPVYMNGAMGVQDDIIYAWIYGYYAGVETGLYDLSVAKDGKVKVTMEVASGTGADLYCDLYVWSDEAGDYEVVDTYTKSALTATFQTLTFELTGASEECFLSIYPFGDPDTYEMDGNLFFRSIKITIEAGDSGEIEIPLFNWEGEALTTTIDKKFVTPGNTYSAAVMAYQLDEEYYIVGESEMSDPIYYTAPAGISDVTVDADNVTPVYYNLQGIRLDRPEGLCIEVKGGKAQKVVK